MPPMMNRLAILAPLLALVASRWESDDVEASEPSMLLQLNLGIDRASSEPDQDINYSFVPPKECWDKVPVGKEIFYLHLGKIGGCSITADLAKVVGRSNIFSNQAGEQQPQNSGRVMTPVIEFFCRLIVSILLKRCAFPSCRRCVCKTHESLL